MQGDAAISSRLSRPSMRNSTDSMSGWYSGNTSGDWHKMFAPMLTLMLESALWACLLGILAACIYFDQATGLLMKGAGGVPD